MQAKVILTATLAALAFTVLASGDSRALECDERNPDYCTTCEEVRRAYSGQDVNITQVRGRSVWTPLYAAYFRGCLELAQSYLERGALPQIGGMEGDMLATVISWDRWEVPERGEWVELLVNAGARLDEPPITQRTTRERLMQEYGQRQDIMQLIDIAEQAGG
ncbi:MAG: hypothetical protein RIM33_03170 [Alphaproteobacteria bacterium]